MAEEFLEVTCMSSGKIRRFAAGTNAGFAVNLMNRKLESGAPRGFYIEAVKEGEESVSFGPNSVLVNYGSAWKLQTVIGEEFAGVGEGELLPPVPVQQPATMKRSDKALPAERTPKPKVSFPTLSSVSPLTAQKSKPVSNFEYFGKIFLAFILIFVLGGIFTLALENLPSLILLINNSLV